MANCALLVCDPTLDASVQSFLFITMLGLTIFALKQSFFVDTHFLVETERYSPYFRCCYDFLGNLRVIVIKSAPTSKDLGARKSAVIYWEGNIVHRPS